MTRLRAVLHSRVLLALGVVVALAVPAVTLPRLSHVSLLPALLGLGPWVGGKYLLCPLRWRTLTAARLSRWWHIRAYAESELLGLFTPGHVGADLWRMRRLTSSGLRRADAVASVALDRFVGAVGLAAFVGFAGAALPTRMVVTALCAATVVLAGLLVVRHVRPDLMPQCPMPGPKQPFSAVAVD